MRDDSDALESAMGAGVGSGSGRKASYCIATADSGCGQLPLGGMSDGAGGEGRGGGNVGYISPRITPHDDDLEMSLYLRGGGCGLGVSPNDCDDLCGSDLEDFVSQAQFPGTQVSPRRMSMFRGSLTPTGSGVTLGGEGPDSVGSMVSGRTPIRCLSLGMTGEAPQVLPVLNVPRETPRRTSPRGISRSICEEPTRARSMSLAEIASVMAANPEVNRGAVGVSSARVEVTGGVKTVFSAAVSALHMDMRGRPKSIVRDSSGRRTDRGGGGAQSVRRNSVASSRSRSKSLALMSKVPGALAVQVLQKSADGGDDDATSAAVCGVTLLSPRAGYNSGPLSGRGERAMSLAVPGPPMSPGGHGSQRLRSGSSGACSFKLEGSRLATRVEGGGRGRHNSLGSFMRDAAQELPALGIPDLSRFASGLVHEDTAPRGLGVGTSCVSGEGELVDSNSDDGDGDDTYSVTELRSGV